MNKNIREILEVVAEGVYYYDHYYTDSYRCSFCHSEQTNENDCHDTDCITISDRKLLEEL